MIPDAEVSPSLLCAFLATEYRVVVDDQTHVISIGAIHTELDRALGHRAWYLISAHNPDARLLDRRANEERHRKLLARIEHAGIDAWSSVNRSRDGNWPDEPGRLVAGAPPDWIHACARACGQVAIVAGQPGQAARLWVYRSERLPDPHPLLTRIE
jgi:hypothetical protein